MNDPTKEIETPIKFEFHTLFEGFVNSNKELSEEEINEYIKEIEQNIVEHVQNEFNLFSYII